MACEDDVTIPIKMDMSEVDAQLATLKSDLEKLAEATAAFKRHVIEDLKCISAATREATEAIKQDSQR